MLEADEGELYRPLRPGPHGRERDRAQVLEDQRRRLHGAMVEAVDRHGYEEVTVAQLVRLAAVSKRTFYEHFSGKEECFLATLDALIDDSATYVRAHARTATSSPERLRALVAGAARYVEAHPKAARLCLLEAPFAGAEAEARLQSLQAGVHEALARAAEDALGEDAPAALSIAAASHGIWHAIRSRVSADDIAGLSAGGGELVEWLLSYRCTAGEALGPAPEIRSARAIASPFRPVMRDARRRMCRAALELAGRHGAAALSETALLELARASEADLRAHYENAHGCFVDALGLLAAEALAHIMAAARSVEARPWPELVRASIAALLDWLVGEPALARVAFVEAFRGGRDVQVRVQYLLCGFANLLRRSAPWAQRPSETVAEGIVAGVWGVLHEYLAAGAHDGLSELTDHLAFIVLAPTIGAQDAIESLRGLREDALPRP